MPTRAENRDDVTARILAAARAQLGSVGPQQLSLRGVARDVGLVSSAVYRYFGSRDELLTALIVEAYDALGDATQAAEVALGRAGRVGTGRYRRRWHAICEGARTWAVAHPHEYALLYGTPVPGYAAPQATVGPGVRVGLQLLQVVHEAAEQGALRRDAVPPAAPALRRQVEGLGLDPVLDGGTQAAVFMAWAQLFGTLSFEVFGQLHGGPDPELFIDHVAGSTADRVGLP
ncbi:TetR/AcrR family transcriptional regulator [Angustibacter aerolatus]